MTIDEAWSLVRQVREDHARWVRTQAAYGDAGFALMLLAMTAALAAVSWRYLDGVP